MQCAGRRRWVLLATALAIPLVGGALAHAESPSPAAAKSKLTTTIGMEGIYYARYSGGALEARPFQENSPITLSIGEVTPVAAADGTTGTRIYELHYIGTRAGQYDLRNYLVRVDGQRLTDLEPMRVSVAAILPKNYDGELESLAPPPLPTVWPYRGVAAGLFTLWILVAVWFLGNRLLRRNRLVALRSDRPLTLADQLRPLVAAAIAGELSAAEKARLERLLIGYWRAALRLDGLPTAEALEIMRRDRPAGELLRQIDAWLYQRPGGANVDVAAILAPYEKIAPLPDRPPKQLPAEVSAR